MRFIVDGQPMFVDPHSDISDGSIGTDTHFL